MIRLMTSVGLADRREFKIRDAMSCGALRHGHSCIDYQATDVMHWVVTFKCIPGNVINSLSNKGSGKFPGELDEEIKLVTENCCVPRGIREATINAATLRASLVKDLCS